MNFDAAASIPKPNVPPPILRKPPKYLTQAKTDPPEPNADSSAESSGSHSKENEATTTVDQNSVGGTGASVKTALVTTSEVGDALQPIIRTVTKELESVLLHEFTSELEFTITNSEVPVSTEVPVITEVAGPAEETSPDILATTDTGSDTESTVTTNTAGTPTVDVELNEAGSAHPPPPASDAEEASSEKLPQNNAALSTASGVSIDNSSTGDKATSNEEDASSVLKPVILPTKESPPEAVDGSSKYVSLDSEDGAMLMSLFQEDVNGKVSQTVEDSSNVSSTPLAAEEKTIDVSESSGDVSESSGDGSKPEVASTEKVPEPVSSNTSDEEEAAAVIVTNILSKLSKPSSESSTTQASVAPSKLVSSKKYFPNPESPPPPVPPRAPLPKKMYALRRKAPKPAYKSDTADKVEVVAKILAVSAKVAEVVARLKAESGGFSRQGSVSTPLAETTRGDEEAYMQAMKPLQFGESTQGFIQGFVLKVGNTMCNLATPFLYPYFDAFCLIVYTLMYYIYFCGEGGGRSQG